MKKSFLKEMKEWACQMRGIWKETVKEEQLSNQMKNPAMREVCSLAQSFPGSGLDMQVHLRNQMKNPTMREKAERAASISDDHTCIYGLRLHLRPIGRRTHPRLHKKPSTPTRVLM